MATVTMVESDENIRVIRQFRKTLQSTMGPQGSSKLVVTGGGYIELAAGSSALLRCVDLENPVCRYIAHIATGLPDHGLCFAIVVCHLLEQFWSNSVLNKEITQSRNVSQSIGLLVATCQTLLESDLVCRRVDFSTIHSFLPLVRSVLTSKTNVLWDKSDLSQFCTEIVKAFLYSVDEQSNVVGRLYVKVKDGLNTISSHNGLLYQITEDYNLKFAKEIIGNVKVIVFTINLEDKNENGFITSNIDKIFKILEEAFKLNIRIVACQKTVASEIKLKLMRKNIVLLERMGTDFTSSLVLMTGAFPISDLDFDIKDLGNILGNISEIKYVQFHESDYIHLTTTTAAVATILISSSSLSGRDNVKELVEQAIGSLKILALHPFLTLGGGCLEIWLIAQINQLMDSRFDKNFWNVLSWLQKALFSACKVNPPTFLDSIYHHGWTEDEDRCRCGLVTKTLLEEKTGVFVPICELVSGQPRSTKLDPPLQVASAVNENIIVDLHHYKMNVVLSALETFSNLSNIKVILYN